MNASIADSPAFIQRQRSRSNCVAFIQTLALRTGRAAAIGFCSLLALLHYALGTALRPRANRLQYQAHWLHQWCKVACAILRLRIVSCGRMPERGLLVSNHLSYLDIIAFCALRPCVFVAKNEVAAWPLFGWLARAAGTIFVQRNRRCDSARAGAAIREALARNVPVVIFPEGTSSDGQRVLPFKSALLEPVRSPDQPVSVAFIGYSMPTGAVADEICYWRDMTFLPHFWNLCGMQKIQAEIQLRAVQHAIPNRKQLALQLHTEIERLGERIEGSAKSFD